MNWFMGFSFIVLGLGALWGGVFFYGRAQWQARTARLAEDLAVATRRIDPPRFVPAEVVALPPPVQRYLAKVLTPGQPRILRAAFRQEGTFNMAAPGGRWKPFSAAERVTTTPPGFLWDAEITMAPGVPVRVHDAYLGGEGVLMPALFGLFPLAQMRGGGPIAEGELMRWLAETPWYPTALLPGQGVTWQAIDDRAALATVTDGAVSVSLTFRFGDDDLIAGIRSEARGRSVGATLVPTPWEGQWSGYARRGGILMPTKGEVAWILPAGAQPYWRGTLTEWSAETAS